MLIHRHVDESGMDDLVGSDAFQAGRFNRRFDQVLVGLVQVEDTAVSKSVFFPKPITTKPVPCAAVSFAPKEADGL